MNLHVGMADDLAVALVLSCGVPTLLLDRNLTIEAASESFCSAFDIRPELVEERELSELGGGEWDLPQLISLLRTVASGHARVDTYEMDLRPRGRPARRLLLKLARLQSAGDSDVRLLISILDQTELQASVQLNEDLARENARLRQQLQLRVANSLQIIASILLFAAQHVRSERLRGQLDDARKRSQAVAGLQKQLLPATGERVDMHSYLTQLCESLGACMISDGRHLTLEVRVDGSFLPPKDATSLGLIVTEMVINAIRHALFNPNFGQIVVSFGAVADGWKLLVKDNGHAVRPDQFKSGLGTGIIEALARQLGAAHAVVSDGTGTAASVVRAGSGTSATGPRA